MAFCISCGTKLGDQDPFCEQCGAKQTPLAPPVAAEPAPIPVPPTALPTTEPEPAAVIPPAPLPTLSQSAPAVASESAEVAAPSPLPIPTAGKPLARKGSSKGKGKWIVRLILLAAIGAGGYTAFANYDKERSEPASVGGFVGFYLEQVGLQKKTNTPDEDKTATETEEKAKEAEKKEEVDVAAETTPAFRYDENGDLIDKDGNLHLKMYKNAQDYYNPSTKKFVRVKNDKLTSITPDVTVYYNKDFGFMLVFPKGWDKVKTAIETAKNTTTGNKETYIKFTLPSKDKEIAEDGRAMLFGLLVVNKADYLELRNDPDAQTDLAFVGRNEKYGIMAYGDGPTASDLDARVGELAEIFDEAFTFH